MVAKLIILTGKHQGKKMALAEGCKIVVGRDEGVAIRLATSEVSRRHCAIRVREGVTSVEDLGSRNGTFVNDSQIEKRTRLRAGDLLKVGPMLFEFQDKTAVKPKPKPKEDGSVDEVVVKETTEDSIVNWLANEEPEPAGTDTVVAKSASDASETGMTGDDGSSDEGGSSAESDVPPPSKEEFESVGEEARDIIRRHRIMKEQAQQS